jgi:hypothetical protein
MQVGFSFGMESDDWLLFYMLHVSVPALNAEGVILELYDEEASEVFSMCAVLFYGFELRGLQYYLFAVLLSAEVLLREEEEFIAMHEAKTPQPFLYLPGC